MHTQPVFEHICVPGSFEEFGGEALCSTDQEHQAFPTGVMLGSHYLLFYVAGAGCTG